MGLNLHKIVTGAISAVNPPVLGNVAVSAGYSIAADGTQIPAYTFATAYPMQVQPLSGKDLRQLDSLNIQGVDRAVYLNGNIQGAVRPLGKGGDLLQFDDQVWLVTVVLETWRTGWCKVGVTLQNTAFPTVVDFDFGRPSVLTFGAI